MTQLDGFNCIAPYYDFLKRAVFGEAINNSQVYFLARLSHCERILVLGGGSGELLRPLLKLNSESTIWFVEASSEMLRRAGERVKGQQSSRIRFIHGTQNDLPPDVKFDALITNFFLICFKTEMCFVFVRDCSTTPRLTAFGLRLTLLTAEGAGNATYFQSCTGFSGGHVTLRRRSCLPGNNNYTPPDLDAKNARASTAGLSGVVLS